MGLPRIFPGTIFFDRLIVKPINILNASKISNNRVRLYLSSKEILAELTDKRNNVEINEVNITIRPLLTKQQRIIISNVCPSIRHIVLEQIIDNLNIRRSSPISSLKAALTRMGMLIFLATGGKYT